MKILIYKDIPCPVLLKKESDIFLIFFKNEQKWIFGCSLGYGEIEKRSYGICYIFNDEYHREDGPAIEYKNGSKEWFQNGKLHRKNGPAVDYYRRKEWWINGKKHRADGPAVLINNGYKEWWVNGKQMPV